MSTDEPRPHAPSLATLAEDLSLSNMEGSSWFGYDYDETEDLLVIELYGDEGKVIKTFTAAFTITEITGK